MPAEASSYAVPFSRFCADFAAGTLAFLPWVPMQELTPGFFRLHGLVAAGLLACAALLAPAAAPLLWAAAGAAAVYALAASVGRGIWVLLALVLALGFSFGGIALPLVREHPGAWRWPLFQAGSSALLLGAALVAMNLGHWYLVVPGLSFGHLKRLTALLFGAILLRGAIGALALAEGWGKATDLLSLVFLLMQVLFGVVAPAVLTYMAWECVKIRSNQSATGILYAVMALVLVGEVASHLQSA